MTTHVRLLKTPLNPVSEALTIADGKEVWQYELGRAIVSSPAISDGMIVIGSNDKNVYAFRAQL